MDKHSSNSYLDKINLCYLIHSRYGRFHFRFENVGDTRDTRRSTGRFLSSDREESSETLVDTRTKRVRRNHKSTTNEMPNKIKFPF